MKVNTNLLIVFLCSALFACKQTEVFEADRNKELFEKYDGTYPIVSAYLEEPYDLNFDGIASTNLLAELPEIKDSDIQIYISKRARFLIVQWAEQYPASSGGGDQYFIYAKQGPHLNFDLDEDETEFIYGPLKEDTALSEDKIKRFASPIRLTIEHDGRIKAIISKTFFTEDGQKDLIIEALFKQSSENDRVYW